MADPDHPAPPVTPEGVAPVGEAAGPQRVVVTEIDLDFGTVFALVFKVFVAGAILVFFAAMGWRLLARLLTNG
jgi:hypothetical protein